MTNKEELLYDIFKKKFSFIIENNEELKKKINYIKNYNFNILLYSKYGFPLDLFLDELIKKKYNIKNEIYRTELVWNKNIIYNENKFFFEIDLMNPLLPKDFNFLNNFIITILKTKNILFDKHLIIIKHINILRNQFSILKILLEKFSNNVFFICTTYNISNIEYAILSRFTYFRIPLFTTQEIETIFKKYLNIELNKYLIENRCRNIIFSLFISDIEKKQPELITKEFCTFNYPPLYQFIKNFKKNSKSLHNIRNFSYNCFQYNIKIIDILTDILKIIPNKDKANIVYIASEIDNKLILTNKGREPIYIENLLINVLL